MTALDRRGGGLYIRHTVNIYYLSQRENTGLDTFDSCVVVAKSPADARKIHPSGGENGLASDDLGATTWAPPKHVTVVRIGTASRAQARGVICASFNAG